MAMQLFLRSLKMESYCHASNFAFMHRMLVKLVVSHIEEKEMLCYSLAKVNLDNVSTYVANLMYKLTP